MEKERMFVNHPLNPVYDRHSRILILGTFPSVKSREVMFYYGNPRNRFYEVLSALLKQDIPKDTLQQKKFLLKNNIAVFDVLRSCEIYGSADSSIRTPVPNDFTPIFRETNIKAVFTNGKKAYQLYNKYCLKQTGRGAICLPSTSPANATISFNQLIADWEIVLDYLK